VGYVYGERGRGEGYILILEIDTGLHQSSRPQLSSPTLVIQPFNPPSITSLFTRFLSSNTPSLLTSSYLLLPKTRPTADTPTSAATLTATLNIPLLQTALAPLASNCLRPCSTPPISVSCHPGLHIADKLLATAFSPAFTHRRLHSNSRLVGATLNSFHLYPPPHVPIISSETPFIRPERLNARSHAALTNCDSGSTNVLIYAFRGETRSDVVADKREKAWRRASLSVQDFERVGGASGREGLRRTVPRRSKFARPRSAAASL